MGWLNGKAVAEAPEMNGRAGANVSALAPAEPVASQALTTPNNQGITAEVARFMPVMDIEQALQRHDVIVQAMKRLMKDGVDYGKIPGCGDKPALLTSMQVRYHVHSIIDRIRMNVPVIAQAEIHRRARVKVVGTI